jgi:hypothetical protein
VTAFRTCHTCARPAAACEYRTALQSAIAGLGITSVKHRCAGYAPAFEPGDAIKVETLAWFHNDEDPPPKLWFPGHFIRLTGQRALVFVPPKAEDLNCEGIEFEPHGNGFLKVPLSRVAHRDAAPMDVRQCEQCGSTPGLGDPCRIDPHYGRKSRCLAECSPKGAPLAPAELGPGTNTSKERPAE